MKIMKFWKIFSACVYIPMTTFTSGKKKVNKQFPFIYLVTQF